MCGFAGILGFSTGHPKHWYEENVKRMADVITHRGPDDFQTWVDSEAGAAFAFRRLSILDLSPNGRQPMTSACGRYTVVFNGEIYNHAAIKSEVEASGKFSFPFRGHSDTEVLLSAFTVWGIEKTLPKTNGMFAIAVWDREKQNLILARDRFGEKTLHYGVSDGAFLFGSELKSLKAFPGFSPALSRSAISLYFRHNCIPAPYTIYEGIKKLPPANFITVNPVTRQISEPTAYWSAKAAAENGEANRFKISHSEILSHLDILLKDAIRLRMEADVPLGAFLSGGIDSSLMVALMQGQSTRPVQTFTIGFNEDKFNEANYAKSVAAHLKTDHTELYITPEQAQDVIALLPGFQDEPYADPSQIPTYLVSKLARGSVTVSLSGDGGDEFFGGYDRYLWSDTVWRRLGHWPRRFRGILSRGFGVIPSEAWDRAFKIAEPLLPERFRFASPGEKIEKLKEVLRVQDSHALYIALTSHFNPPSEIVLQGEESPTLVTRFNEWAKIPSPIERMLYFDSVTYLPDDVLTKVDRASMAVSLEARAPFLDHRIYEFAWHLPLSEKIYNGKGKRILRELLAKYVPKELFERPKKGFSVPIGDWIRGPLRPWAESLISEEKLKQQGYLKSEKVRALWDEHQSLKRDRQHQLWDILQFQAWLETV